MPKHTLPSRSELEQPWPAVRLSLLKCCGLYAGENQRSSSTTDDARTQHCFADANHMECCVPPKKTYNNSNANGRVQGISRQNRLPFASHNGCWCTCQSAQVCKNQFGTLPRWTAVWVQKCLVIARGDTILVAGFPKPPLPPLNIRRQSYQYYSQHYPQFAQRVKKHVSMLNPSSARQSIRKVKRKGKSQLTKSKRTSQTAQTATRKKNQPLPLCNTIDPNLKRNAAHPTADQLCICPSTQKRMSYPRKHSYNECKQYRLQNHKGSTVKSSCAAYF